MTSICGFEKNQIAERWLLSTGGNTETMLTNVSRTTIAMSDQFMYELCLILTWTPPIVAAPAFGSWFDMAISSPSDNGHPEGANSVPEYPRQRVSETT
jgi:hypothetical protein